MALPEFDFDEDCSFLIRLHNKAQLPFSPRKYSLEELRDSRTRLMTDVASDHEIETDRNPLQPLTDLMALCKTITPIAKRIESKVKYLQSALKQLLETEFPALFPELKLELEKLEGTNREKREKLEGTNRVKREKVSRN